MSQRAHMPALYIIAIIVMAVVAGAILWPDIQSSFYLSEKEVDQRLQNSAKQLNQQKEREVPTVSADTVTKENITVVAQNLHIPWDIAFLPDSSLLVTERPGALVRIKKGNKTRTPVREVKHHGEGGLLGIALHPNFSNNRLLYLYTTTTTNDGNVINRVVRFRFNMNDNSLADRKVIIGGIPGASYHDGGRLAFSPRGNLFATAGDAGDDGTAQSTSTLAGSILRVTPDGGVPGDNPFDNAIYSYGHRNPQGLTWDALGRLWSTEHGRSGLKSGFDEVNLIQKGRNYGWPVIQGPEDNARMIAPVAQSGANTTWAPASAVYHKGSIFFGGLRGSAIYEAVLSNTEVTQVVRHFYNDFGRIRTVTKGPDGNFYITTSNTDGRGNPRENDDKIIRIDVSVFER